MKLSLSSLILGLVALINFFNLAAASPVETSSDASLLTRRSGPGFSGAASSAGAPAYGVGARGLGDTPRAKREPPVGQLSAWMMNSTQCLGTPANIWTNPTQGQCLTWSPSGTPVAINRLKWNGNFCAVFVYNSNNCVGPVGIPTFPPYNCVWAIDYSFYSFKVVC